MPCYNPQNCRLSPCVSLYSSLCFSAYLVKIFDLKLPNISPTKRDFTYSYYRDVNSLDMKKERANAHDDSAASV